MNRAQQRAQARRAAKCQHKNIPVEFDSEAAKGMSSNEVRSRFPRFYGPCPDCREVMIQYASWEHYIAGDW